MHFRLDRQNEISLTSHSKTMLKQIYFHFESHENLNESIEYRAILTHKDIAQ